MLYFELQSIVEVSNSCALQYILLHLLGYKLSMDDLKGFRQLDSVTPGHPESTHTDGEQFHVLIHDSS
jgi:transketolase